jgi:hypothetical protein
MQLMYTSVKMNRVLLHSSFDSNLGRLTVGFYFVLQHWNSVPRLYFI